MPEPRIPDVFIVGGPKCGTTALYACLARHPGIHIPPCLFRPPGKSEPSHFATDLLQVTDHWYSREFYLSVFQDAPDDALIVDASVHHLFSKVAARNISEFNCHAKIIIMLRNPVEVVHSWHRQMLYNGDEFIADLGEALAAEAGRREPARAFAISRTAAVPGNCLFRRSVVPLPGAIRA